MTGRQWHHFSVEMTRMVSGLFGLRPSSRGGALGTGTPRSAAAEGGASPREDPPEVPGQGQPSMNATEVDARFDLGDGWRASTTTEDDR